MCEHVRLLESINISRQQWPYILSILIIIMDLGRLTSPQ